MGCSNSKPINAEPPPPTPPPTKSPSSPSKNTNPSAARQSPNHRTVQQQQQQQPQTVSEDTHASSENDHDEHNVHHQAQSPTSATSSPPAAAAGRTNPTQQKPPAGREKQLSSSSTQSSLSKTKSSPRSIRTVRKVPGTTPHIDINGGLDGGGGGGGGGRSAYTKSAPVGSDDPSWVELWKAHRGRKPGQSMVIDPADVHSTLNDLMARMTNKLSETEMLFLQRKVRAAVRMSVNVPPEKTGRKGRLSAAFQSTANSTLSSSTSTISNSNPADSKAIADKYHLLTPYVVRKVLPIPPEVPSSSSSLAVPMAPTLSKATSSSSAKSLSSLGASNHNNNNNNNSSGGGGNNTNTNEIHPSMDYNIQPTETTYLLALYCNDSLWDRVADIARISAQDAGLEMEV